MKYARLTKEQFDELHPEFINFLATQSITASEWKEIKTNKPNVAEEELDIFSDLVWEGVLGKAEYLEHFSPDRMHLFKLLDDGIQVIAVQVKKQDIDVTTPEGYKWMRENLKDESVHFYNGKKAYSEHPKTDVFSFIQQGAVITKGELFEWFASFVLE